jgi:anti-sigma regulatory factor (Ser/Thr protein kinase)
LPYDPAALELHISGEIMELHHDKHHAAYVKGANTALEKRGPGDCNRADQGRVQGMDEHLSLRPDPAVVAAARRFVADTLTGWDSDHDRDSALMLVSELVTNAVVHAGTDIALTLRYEAPLITVEVHDDNHRMPVLLNIPPTATSGRGLHLVAAMAHDWGVRSIPGDGKDIWFSLRPQYSGVARYNR